MIEADIKNIILNENAYFFKTTKKIAKKDIENLFRECRDSKNAKPKYKSIIRRSFNYGGKEYAKYSLDIFVFEKKPSFHMKEESGFKEIKFGFFLIVEHSTKSYISIIKKQVSGTKSLKYLIEGIEYETLSHFLIDNKTKFEKVQADNMNTADNAFRRRTYETGTDLSGSFSKFGASKNIINTLRVDNQGIKSSIALNTSRVNSLNTSQNFEDVINWLIKVMNKIDIAHNNKTSNPFIDSFATPVKYSSIINSLTPNHILIRFEDIKNELDLGLIESFIDSTIGEEESTVDIKEIIKKYSTIKPLKRDKSNLYYFEDIEVKINTKSITLSCEVFKSITIKYKEGAEITLEQYINRNNLFVNFDQFEYVYTHKKIFKDSKLLNNIEGFLEVFIPDLELEEIDSEKGENYVPTSTQFQPNSLFRFIENRFKGKSECLICDDQGAEWGDFIALNEDGVIFIHAKHKNKNGLSATNLQDVFGQVFKNLGYLELTESMILYRKIKWEKNYRLDNVQTKIKRFRKTKNKKYPIKNILEMATKIGQNPNHTNKINIVIDFLSKEKLRDSLILMKSGSEFEHKGVISQILWFTSSLIAACNERGVKFQIICKP